MRLSRALVLTFVFAAAGCRFSRAPQAPLPLAQRVSWCGRAATSASDSALADTALPQACMRVHHLEFAGPEGPFHLELREYRTPYWAFAAWQNAASAAPNTKDGCFKQGSRWVFIHGPFVGFTDSSAASLYPGEFKDRMAFAAEPGFALPPEFESFPLLGRIPGSERVVARDFLGGQWSGPVFSAEYRCHGDSALAFRAFPQQVPMLDAFMSGWRGRKEPMQAASKWRFSGQDEFFRPMILEVFSEGVVGFSGCFDPEMAREYVEKLRKTQVFWHHP